MTAVSPLGVLLLVLGLASSVTAQSVINEEFAVRALEGYKQASMAVLPPSIAFALPLEFDATLPPQKSPEIFFKKLIPLGRALETEPLSRFRFLLSVSREGTEVDHPSDAVQKRMAEQIKYALTTYFAISDDRLIITTRIVSDALLPQLAEPRGLPRWRVEVSRQE